ncbi:hypothetical protein [Egicoccus sp. AB-alg2]|uniref:hypothetical protein n=1 Tax=Egicoccus sp. AB-alg2 TaxID=3242693 RepID=UPI00359D33CC
MSWSPLTSRATAATNDHRRRPARLAALAATAMLVTNGFVALAGDVDEHTTGLGLVSEVTAGLAFLAGAVALALIVPVTGWRALLWWLAPTGMTLAGLTMVSVPVAGSEPPDWLFVLAVLPTFVGLVAAGVLGTGRRWPWWTGAGVAAFLPIMFLLPPFANGFGMALVWLAVALAADPGPAPLPAVAD